MCYYFANNSLSSRVTWRAARQACQSVRGGDLVSIHSAAENNFIKSKIARYVLKTFHVSFECCTLVNVPSQRPIHEDTEH